MFARLAQKIGTLVVALGIVMGAVGPSWAGINPSNIMHPAVAKMQMQMLMQNDCMGMAKKGSTHKQMPCDGTGCGCCLSGTCATASPLDVALSVQLLERPSENDFADDVFPKGVVSPPTLPPPILRA